MNMHRRAHDQQRQQLAQHAARLMAESGSRDVLLARRKAARQLRINDPALLPDEAQVLQALRDHLRLFPAVGQGHDPQLYRDAAIQAMEFLATFSPRLTGAVLEGTADARSVVQLHLHTDEPEAVQRFLEDHRVPVRACTTYVRLGSGPATALPGWQLDADGIAFELAALPERALRQPPLSPGSNDPLPRASLRQLRSAPPG